MKSATLAILMISVLGMLSGCISGKPKADTYTDPSGNTTLIENDREHCEHACNDEYSRCMDTEAAHTNPVDGSPAGMFGASSDCRSDISRCLSDCKTR